MIGLEIRPQLLQRVLFQHLRMGSALVDVVLKDVPSSKNDVVQVRQRNKFLNQRRLVLRPFAQPDGAHLRQRSDWFGQSAPHRFHARNHGGGYRTQSHHHHTQLALCRRNLRRSALSFARHRSSPVLSCSAYVGSLSALVRRYSVLNLDLPHLMPLTAAPHVRPDKPDDRRQQRQFHRQVEAMEDLFQPRIRIPSLVPASCRSMPGRSTK